MSKGQNGVTKAVGVLRPEGTPSTPFDSVKHIPEILDSVLKDYNRV
jgi:hypothetical protein